MSARGVFITGGASGLGRALAVRWARAGWRVAIGDVNAERGTETLALLAGAAASRYLHCDVTRDDDVEAAADTLWSEWGGVDVVVNNAGVAQAGGIGDVSMDDWRWVIEINLLGVVRGCRTFTPRFRQQGRGHFVNVASMAGLLDVPLMGSYNASKAAVVSLSETLQNELWDDGIGVTLVCPSFFQTNLHETMRSPDPALRATMQRLLARGPLTADDVADAVYQAVEKRAFHVLPHADGRRTWLLKRFLPRRIYSALIRREAAFLRRAPRTA